MHHPETARDGRSKILYAGTAPKKRRKKRQIVSHRNDPTITAGTAALAEIGRNELRDG